MYDVWNGAWLIVEAEAISEKIGYPEYIMNDTALNADYEAVSTS